MNFARISQDLDWIQGAWWLDTISKLFDIPNVCSTVLIDKLIDSSVLFSLRINIAFSQLASFFSIHSNLYRVCWVVRRWFLFLFQSTSRVTLFFECREMRKKKKKSANRKRVVCNCVVAQRSPQVRRIISRWMNHYVPARQPII